MSFIGGMEGLKATGIDMSMDKEARHFRKYLYQNRVKFENIIEQLPMFDTDNLKNWLLLGNLMTIFVGDIIQIFLTSQDNMKISLGLVETMQVYSSFFSKTHKSIEYEHYDKLPAGVTTIFDQQTLLIQY